MTSESTFLPGAFAGLGSRRLLAGGVLELVGLPLLTVAFRPHRDTLPFAIPVLLVLLLVVTGALLGGVRIALPGAVAGVLLLNWFFTPPYGTLAIDSAAQVVVLAVYLVVAVAVSLVVDLAARRTAESLRARAEARTLSELAGATLAEAETLPGLLDRVRQVFRVEQVELQERDGAVWSTVEAIGNAGPDSTALVVPSGQDLQLVVHGQQLFAADRAVLQAFADAAGTALEGRRLAQRAARAAELEAADRVRTALLAAVGHDLRTPLAGVKAAVSSLRQADVAWTAQETAELLATVEEGADRLQGLVSNLLDASRLQAGALTASPVAVGLDELVGRVLLGTAERGRVHVEVADDLPDVLADAGLAERVLANVLENALRHSPAGLLVTVRGSRRAGGVLCEVVDHGPGLPEGSWETVFEPFQRLGDRSPGGTGLGLSVARGFAEAMGASLVPARTEGGGLTMRLFLPVAR